MKSSYSLILLGFSLLLSCLSKQEEIEGFDKSSWKNDRFGCKNHRAGMVANIFEAKDKIMGLREPEVLDLFGKADEQEIYSRNQKFLIYYLEPNANCELPEKTEATANALYLRLNALGVANELYLNKR